MISKFKKRRRTIRPPFNAGNVFLLGTVRMMFWRRCLRQKIVKHKRGSRSRRGQQHDDVALAKEECVPLDKVEFETRWHRRDGVFSDPHPMVAGIAGEVGGGAEEMDVVEGVSTPRCSRSIEEPMVDSPASYISTGTSERATFTDAAIEEMQALSDLRIAELNEQKELNERLQKIIEGQQTVNEQAKLERVEIIDDIEDKNIFLNTFIESYRVLAVRGGWYKCL